MSQTNINHLYSNEMSQRDCTRHISETTATVRLQQLMIYVKTRNTVLGEMPTDSRSNIQRTGG